MDRDVGIGFLGIEDNLARSPFSFEISILLEVENGVFFSPRIDQVFKYKRMLGILISIILMLVFFFYYYFIRGISLDKFKIEESLFYIWSYLKRPSAQFL